MKRFRAKVALAASIALTGAVVSPVLAQDGGLFGNRTASVAIGPYLRMELGAADPAFDDGYWRPPGYNPAPGIGDPEISFSLSGDTTHMGSIAFGHDWQGWRADVALSYFSNSTASGPCASADDGSSCSTHADIDRAPVSSTTIMGNVFYAPFEARGSNSVFQPFIVGGLGVARNEVGDWTRTNDSGVPRPVRTFAGDTTTSFAWSVGLGASYQVTRPGRWPVLLEATWRYYDLGEAKGSSVALPGNGASQPVQPLTFDTTQSVVSVGIRIPLERY